MKNEENKIETLEEPKIEDIPTTFFRPIEDIKEQNRMQNYEKQETPNISYENEVKVLEKKLAQKKLDIPFFFVVILVIFINLAWFLSVRFLIVPKYENYVSQNEEIKANYDSLKRKVDAIAG